MASVANLRTHVASATKKIETFCFNLIQILSAILLTDLLTINFGIS